MSPWRRNVAGTFHYVNQPIHCDSDPAVVNCWGAMPIQFFIDIESIAKIILKCFYANISIVDSIRYKRSQKIC